MKAPYLYLSIPPKYWSYDSYSLWMPLLSETLFRQVTPRVHVCIYMHMFMCVYPCFPFLFPGVVVGMFFAVENPRKENLRSLLGSRLLVPPQLSFLRPSQSSEAIEINVIISERENMVYCSEAHERLRIKNSFSGQIPKAGYFCWVGGEVLIKYCRYQV